MRPEVTAEPSAERTGWRREARSFVELFALSGFAFAQPLLDLFGRAPHQFVFRGAEGTDLVLFGLTVVLVPPAVLWAVEAAVGLASETARRWLHLVLLGALAWAFAIQAFRPLATGAPLLAIAVVLGATAALLYHRFRAAELWLAFAAVAPLAFLVLFLLASPSSRLLAGDEVVAEGGGVGNPVPLVMVVFDEFPLTSIMTSDGEIDAELFPNFADLAQDSHWFRNTTSVTTFTWHALPSIVTGRMPIHDTAPFAHDHPQNLFTLLGGSYRLNVVESMTRLCPTSLCEPVSGRRQLFRDAVDIMRARLSYSGPEGDPVAGFVEQAAAPAGAEELPDEEVAHTERLGALLDGIVDDSLTLHYLHLLLPHQPLRWLPSGRQYDGPDPDIGRDGDDWEDQEWPTILGRQRHVLQVAYVDALLGQILDRLRATGTYDDALVVVVADHGIAFRPGHPVRLLEGQRIDETTAPELMWVPFFVKLPGQDEGVVSDDNVLVIDVLPTIADVLQLDLPEPVEGRSAFGPARADDPKPFRHGEVHAFGVGITDDAEIDGASGFEALFDLTIDRLVPPPGEPHRLWRVGPSSELVGEPAAGLPAATATVHGAPFDVDEGASVVPALVRADLHDAEPGEGFAVAVNGVVAATGVAYLEDGQPALAVMVDDTRFEPGRNEVTVHRL